MLHSGSAELRPPLAGPRYRAGCCSVADGLLRRYTVQPGHAAAHSAQGQMCALAKDRGHLVGQPVDHEELREAHRIGLKFFDSRCGKADVQADVRLTPQRGVFIGNGDTGGLVILRQLQTLLQFPRTTGG